jgi:hypothetical protein
MTIICPICSFFSIFFFRLLSNPQFEYAEGIVTSIKAEKASIDGKGEMEGKGGGICPPLAHHLLTLLIHMYLCLFF